jgi:hypothetical protein
LPHIRGVQAFRGIMTDTVAPAGTPVRAECTHGKPHHAYLIAFAMVAVRLVREPLVASHAWFSITGWIAGLAG